MRGAARAGRAKVGHGPVGLLGSPTRVLQPHPLTQTTANRRRGAESPLGSSATRVPRKKENPIRSIDDGRARSEQLAVRIVAACFMLVVPSDRP